MIVTYALTGSACRVSPSGNDGSSYGVVDVDDARARPRVGRLPRSRRGARLLDQHRQHLHALRADDDVDERRALEQPCAFLLRDAAGDRDERRVAGRALAAP